MTTEEIIIAIVRILASLPVLFFPFYGALLAVFADLSDLFLMNLLDQGGVRDYQSFDKWCDQVYMLTFLIVALRWQGPARNIAIGLYAYRMVGFIAFEAAQERALLIFFPNVFEYWFIFVAALKHFHLEATPESEYDLDPDFNGRGPSPDLRPERVLVPFRYTASQLAIILPILLAAKLAHEYMLHVGKWFDGFTAVEAIEAIWNFLTPPY